LRTQARRLRAAAQSRGIVEKELPELLFVCERNAGRSQMAAAFAQKLSNGWVGVRSAGSHPEEQIDPVVVEAMSELGVDVTVEFPKPLTDEALNKVFVLEAPGKGIKSLKGLEKCKNLSLLKVTKNEISDLTPLKDLTNLQSLDLAGNKITDVSPLSGLVGLQYLELSDNQVAKLDPAHPQFLLRLETQCTRVGVVVAGDVRRVVVVGGDFDQAAVDEIEHPAGRVVRADARIEIRRR